MKCKDIYGWKKGEYAAMASSSRSLNALEGIPPHGASAGREISGGVVKGEDDDFMEAFAILSKGLVEFVE